MPEILLKPTPAKQAAEFIASKPVVSRRVFERMLPELKARHFVISGVESASVSQRIRDKLAELPAGGDWGELQHEVARELGPYFVDPEEKDEDARAAQAQAAERRAQLLLRTHGFQSYQAMQHEVMQAVKQELPYWQYLTMGDENVRESHAALDGIVMPADSPFWDAHYPPWEWGCRCMVAPVSRDEAGAMAEDAESYGRVLSETEQQELEQNNRLAMPSGQVVDVASDWQKGREGALRWKPGDLRIPLEDLRERYDERVWAAFERSMRSERIEEYGVSVWEWLQQGAT